MTFDEQLIIEYFKMVNEYSDYWDRKSTDGSSSTPISATSDDAQCVYSSSYESFIDNAPPGLPKGKESANGRSRPRKGKESSTWSAKQGLLALLGYTAS